LGAGRSGSLPVFTELDLEKRETAIKEGGKNNKMINWSLQAEMEH
jgi:hypothetical protein